MNKKNKKALNRMLGVIAGIALLGLAVDPQLKNKLACAAVLLLAAAVEIGFAASAECRVFRPGMRRPCPRRTWGILLGCHDHRPTKLLAWIGYLGAERLMRRLGMPRAFVATTEELPPPPSVPGASSSVATQATAGETRLNDPGQREGVGFACMLVSTAASVLSLVVAIIAL